ncbi:MAG TPA: rod shape-determining protein MreD [Steroidobacteraceae bacterium]|nr:rod shape-determining protein MreD [Steroidobacteraceae bacterium]
MMPDRIGWLRILWTSAIALLLTIAPLPDAINAARPDWLLLLVIYWTLNAPLLAGLSYAWICGLLMDALVGTLLGQYALTFVVIAAVAHRFQLRMRIFPVLQQAAIVLLLVLLYHWLLYVISGFAGEQFSSWLRWLPAVAGALFWPLLVSVLDTVNRLSK